MSEGISFRLDIGNPSQVHPAAVNRVKCVAPAFPAFLHAERNALPARIEHRIDHIEPAFQQLFRAAVGWVQ